MCGTRWGQLKRAFGEAVQHASEECVKKVYSVNIRRCCGSWESFLRIPHDNGRGESRPLGLPVSCPSVIALIIILFLVAKEESVSV